MKRILFAFAMLLCLSGYGQETGITNGTIEQCGGFLVDSGLSASDYSNNEDFTMTICPVAPDTIINLYFNLFDLGEGDVLSIYDGDDTSAPLLGSFSDTDAQADNITSTSGCLTVHFTSDASDVGNFVAEISCGPPCERPFAIVETSEDPTDTIRVCVDEPITFDGSNSEYAEGQQLESYTWNWGDGTETSTGGIVQDHSYDSPGDYKVNLFITDDNECSNNNLTERIILVSTPPSFEGTTPGVLGCTAQEIDLNGVVTGVTWDGTPDIDFGGALFIPDDQTQCFQNDITFNSLIAGGTISSPNDIENIFINFEHSFMGDLTITLICPNGQSMALHQQGGGGTFLGEPIDDGSDTPGVGYDYYWAPDATNGSWADESTGVTTLPSGTYSSTQDWSLLEGCPLNGTWEIEICDSWAADNGFIFDWTMNFDPSMFAELITFTPTFGEDCDSTFWTLDGEPVPGTGNCNDVTVNHDQPGTYNYMFNGVDNFGCTYSDTVTVQIEDRPEVELNGETALCGDEVTLTADLLNENDAFDGYFFEWSPTDLVNPVNAQTTVATGFDATTDFIFLTHPNGIPECITQDTITVEVNDEDPLVMDVEVIGESDCPGDPIQLSVVAEGGFPGYTYEWTDLNLTTVFSVDSVANVNPQTSTVYEIAVSDQCETITQEIEVPVNLPEPLSVDNEVLCVGSGGQLNISGGSGNFFLTSDLLEFEDPTQPNFPTNNAGVFQILIADQCSAIQPVTALIEINGCSINVPNIFSPNGDNINDALVFEGLLDYPNGSTLIVKNRWGREVYSSTSYQNDWSPSDLPEGTYYYILQTTLDEDIAGYITLVR
ncbi:T9SS type B sorting domain-containing protein [Halocola ammonii]